MGMGGGTGRYLCIFFTTPQVDFRTMDGVHGVHGVHGVQKKPPGIYQLDPYVSLRVYEPRDMGKIYVKDCVDKEAAVKADEEYTPFTISDTDTLMWRKCGDKGSMYFSPDKFTSGTYVLSSGGRKMWAVMNRKGMVIRWKGSPNEYSSGVWVYPDGSIMADNGDVLRPDGIIVKCEK